MITSYDTLKASVADWLARGDLTTQIPEFIQLAEAEIKRRLRVRTIRATLAISAASTPLPSDCAELRSLSLVSGSPWLDTPISLGTKEQLDQTRAAHSGVTGRPRRAAVVGSTLLVAPAPDQAYACDVTYFEKLVPLTAGGASNAVLDASPDVYLWGALMHAAKYLQHDERVAVWKAEFEAALAQLEAERDRQETAASLRPARLPAVF